MFFDMKVSFKVCVHAKSTFAGDEKSVFDHKRKL